MDMGDIVVGWVGTVVGMSGVRVGVVALATEVLWPVLLVDLVGVGASVGVGPCCGGTGTGFPCPVQRWWWCKTLGKVVTRIKVMTSYSTLTDSIHPLVGFWLLRRSLRLAGIDRAPGMLVRVMVPCTLALVTTPPTPQQLTMFNPFLCRVRVRVRGILVRVLMIPVRTLRAQVRTLRLPVIVTVCCLLVPVRVTRPLVLVRLARSWVLTPWFMLILVTLTDKTLKVALVLRFPSRMAPSTLLGPLRIRERLCVELMSAMTFLLMWVTIAVLLVLLMRWLTPVWIAIWVWIPSLTLPRVIVETNGALTIPGPMSTRMVLRMLWLVRLTV